MHIYTRWLIRRLVAHSEEHVGHMCCCECDVALTAMRLVYWRPVYWRPVYWRPVYWRPVYWFVNGRIAVCSADAGCGVAGL